MGPPNRRLVEWIGRWVLIVCIGCMGLARAAPVDRIDVTQFSLDSRDDGWAVNADFDLSLNQHLEDALDHGLPLYFKVDFELYRPRWWWLDDTAAETSLTYRLSYYALTREYRLSTGSLQLGFRTLDEALRLMTRLRNWRVMDKNAVHPGDTYVAGLRMHLDTSQLPKPFQINALTSREWTLDSDWKRFSFEVPR